MLNKLVFALFAVLSGWVITLVLTAASFLSTLNPLPAGLDLSRLAQGRVLDIFFLPAFWAVYPSTPASYINMGAVLLAAALTGCILYFWVLRPNQSVILAAFFFLVSPFVPYVIGRLALLNNTLPEQAGGWLAFMLYSIFYLEAASLVFSISQAAQKSG